MANYCTSYTLYLQMNVKEMHFSSEIFGVY